MSSSVRTSEGSGSRAPRISGAPGSSPLGSTGVGATAASLSSTRRNPPLEPAAPRIHSPSTTRSAAASGARRTRTTVRVPLSAGATR